MKKKIISIICPCFNENDVIENFYKELYFVTNKIKNYSFNYIFIDNCSTDGTKEKLLKFAKNNKDVKLIFNSRNFGHIRSPYWGFLQSTGDASIFIATDLQEPPKLIKDFLVYWEQGYKVVLAVKSKSKTNFLMHNLRKLYYSFLDSISEVKQIKNSTGFGLYDKKFVDLVKQVNDPYPYMRGFVNEFGLKYKEVEFIQDTRKGGITKNNFFTLYDLAILGIVSHSKIPIRISIFFGFLLGSISLLLSIFFLLLKIIYWESFQLGLAPLIISLFFLMGMLFIFIGIIGEYILSIHRNIQNRPIVVEDERVNFDK